MPKIFYSIDHLNRFLKSKKPSKICIVISQVLAKKLKWATEEIKYTNVEITLIPDGEKAKEWDEVRKLLEKFTRFNLDRSSIIIALGGGAVGDMVGFAAAIYLRGIRYIQVPTTLLAQVDSSHGGKTAINFLNCKNQIGNFYEPIAIIIDKRFLESLSKEQIIDGLGEIIKAGLIKDQAILSLLKKENIGILIKSPNLLRIISKAIKVKQHYVSTDFKDYGQRQILNVGHTLGHSIELKYKTTHGKAVIIGMLQEIFYTESMGFTHPSVRKNLINLLDHLEIKIDSRLKPDWKTVLHDKKISGNKIVFPVVEKEGKVKLITFSVSNLKGFIQNLTYPQADI